jgi:hypothetical protein
MSLTTLNKTLERIERGENNERPCNRINGNRRKHNNR